MALTPPPMTYRFIDGPAEGEHVTNCDLDTVLYLVPQSEVASFRAQPYAAPAPERVVYHRRVLVTAGGHRETVYSTAPAH